MVLESSLCRMFTQSFLPFLLQVGALPTLVVPLLVMMVMVGVVAIALLGLWRLYHLGMDDLVMI